MATRLLVAATLAGVVATGLATATTSSTEAAPGLLPETGLHAAGDDEVRDDSRLLPGLRGDDRNTQARRTSSRVEATTHRVFVAVVSVTNTTADDDYTVGELSEAAATTALASTDAYWNEQSLGGERFSLAGYQVVGGLGLTDCDRTEILNRTAAKAFGGKFAARSGVLDHLLVATTEGSDFCDGFAGYGGGYFVLDFNGFPPDGPVLKHEFGHDLGFGHANGVLCPSSVQDVPSVEVTETGPCKVIEYADSLDVMGSTGNANLNAIHRIFGGWLPETDYVRVTGADPQSLTIKPLDGTGVRAAQVRDPRSGVWYTFEYRTATGADADEWEYVGTSYDWEVLPGWSLRRFDGDPAIGNFRVLREEGSTRETVVLSAGTVDGNSSLRRQRMLPSEAFTTYTGGFTVTLDSLVPAEGATFHVSYPPAAPTSSVLTLKQDVVQYGNDIRALVEVRVGGQPVTQGRVAIYADGVQLASGPVGRTVRVPARIALGSHTLTAEYLPAPTLLGSVSQAVPVTVTRHRTQAKVIPLTGALRAGTEERIRLAVLAPSDSSSPLLVRGKVALYVAGRLVTTARLRGSDWARVTVRVPARQMRVGRLYAKYLGSSLFRPDRSRGWDVLGRG